jgi:hypothetical protein
MEQAPGPRASPQLPQELTEFVSDALPIPDFDETANTESCCDSLPPSHFGHLASWPPFTMASNAQLHSSQMYSKIGIVQTSTGAAPLLHLKSISASFAIPQQLYSTPSLAGRPFADACQLFPYAPD